MGNPIWSSNLFLAVNYLKDNEKEYVVTHDTFDFTHRNLIQHVCSISNIFSFFCKRNILLIDEIRGKLQTPKGDYIRELQLPTKKNKL